MSHPYKKFENTPLWAVINNGIDDLVENNILKKVHKEITSLAISVS